MTLHPGEVLPLPRLHISNLKLFPKPEPAILAETLTKMWLSVFQKQGLHASKHENHCGIYAHRTHFLENLGQGTVILLKI